MNIFSNNLNQKSCKLSINKNKFENKFINKNLRIQNFNIKNDSIKSSNNQQFDPAQSHFSFENQMLACTDDHTIHLWERDTGLKIRELQGHTSKVIQIALVDEQNLIISVSEDDVLKLWNINNGDCIQTLNIVEKSKLSSVYLIESNKLSQIDFDGRLNMFTLFEDGKAFLWKIPQPDQIQSKYNYQFEKSIQSDIFQNKDSKVSNYDKTGLDLDQYYYSDMENQLNNLSTDDLSDDLDTKILFKDLNADKTIDDKNLKNDQKIIEPTQSISICRFIGHNDKIISINVDNNSQVYTASIDQSIKKWTMEGVLINSYQINEEIESFSVSGEGNMFNIKLRDDRSILQDTDKRELSYISVDKIIHNQKWSILLHLSGYMSLRCGIF